MAVLSHALLCTLALAVLGCGGKSATSSAASGGAGGGGGGDGDGNGNGNGEPAADCEPGRCLDDIARTVKAHRTKARACFDARIAKQPDLPGNRVLINFAIEADGTVSEASQSVKGDQIEDAELVDCITTVIKGITFARSAKGKRTRAYHSFEFAR